MLTKQDLTNIRDVVEVAVEEALEEKLGPAIDAKLDTRFDSLEKKVDRIENTIDATHKIVSDTRDELTLTQAKVDRHDTEIKDLQTFTGFATA
jgi:uncharacterized coiled-coil protein SlyX